MSHAKSAKAAKGAGGMRIYKNPLNAAVRSRMAWPGEAINIENHENRFADMERREGHGWTAGARASRPRGSRKAENKRKRQCFL